MYGMNRDNRTPGWYSVREEITQVVFNSSFSQARPTSTYAWFYEMVNISGIDGLGYLNTSQVTNMQWMFGLCNNLTSLDVSKFDTSNVTNMYCMFYDCKSLSSLDVVGRAHV